MSQNVIFSHFSLRYNENYFKSETMKKLYLFRHADASWPKGVETDFDRPLSEVGIKQAQDSAAYLQKQGVNPDYFVCSSALRAHSTANYFAQGVDVTPSALDELYNAGHEQLLATIKAAKDTDSSMILVAHNPGISMLATQFLGIYEDLAPCTMVELHFECEKWDQIDRKNLVVDQIRGATI